VDRVIPLQSAICIPQSPAPCSLLTTRSAHEHRLQRDRQVRALIPDEIDPAPNRVGRQHDLLLPASGRKAGLGKSAPARVKEFDVCRKLTPRHPNPESRQDRNRTARHCRYSAECLRQRNRIGFELQFKQAGIPVNRYHLPRVHGHRQDPARRSIVGRNPGVISVSHVHSRTKRMLSAVCAPQLPRALRPMESRSLPRVWAWSR
jgi:hypothetical protein